MRIKTYSSPGWWPQRNKNRVDNECFTAISARVHGCNFHHDKADIIKPVLLNGG
jgi:hypothetical protein